MWSEITGIIIDPEIHSNMKFGGNVDDPPIDFLQRTTIYTSLGLRIVIIVLTGIAQAITATILFMIVQMRKNVIIRASSIKFCVVMLLSALTLLSVLYLLAVPETTDAVCQARQIVGHTAFCSLFSAMLAKSWRVQRLMGASRTLKKLTIKDQELFRVVFGVLVVVLTVLIIWIVKDGPRSVYVYDQDSRTKVSGKLMTNRNTFFFLVQLNIYIYIYFFFFFSNEIKSLQCVRHTHQNGLKR